MLRLDCWKPWARSPEFSWMEARRVEKWQLADCPTVLFRRSFDPGPAHGGKASPRLVSLRLSSCLKDESNAPKQTKQQAAALQKCFPPLLSGRPPFNKRLRKMGYWHPFVGAKLFTVYCVKIHTSNSRKVYTNTHLSRVKKNQKRITLQKGTNLYHITIMCQYIK